MKSERKRRGMKNEKEIRCKKRKIEKTSTEQNKIEEKEKCEKNTRKREGKQMEKI